MTIALKTDEAHLHIPEEPAPPIYRGGGGYIPLDLNSPFFDPPAVYESSIPLGVGLIPVYEPSYVISEVAEPITTETEAEVFQTVDRRDMSVAIAPRITWQDYLNTGASLPSDWNQYPMYSDYLIAQGGAIEPIVPDEEDDMSLLGDIYEVVDAGLGGILPGGVPYQVPTGWGGPMGPIYNQNPATLPTVQVGGGMQPPPPPVNVGGSCSPDDPYKGMVYKRVCGQWKWVKKKYRRRKQLFTSRDASQLSSLLGIAGKSEIAKTWIASHPS